MMMEYPGKTCYIGYGSATKLTYEQRGDPRDRTRSDVVRGECFDPYCSPTCRAGLQGQPFDTVGGEFDY